MARRKMEDKNIRKLTKVGGKSIGVTLPIEIIREFKWKEKQKVVVKKRGNSIIITDWKK
jgi:antitoxin component of MazEF toxin-antitoxin module